MIRVRRRRSFWSITAREIATCAHPIDDAAGVADVILEAAVTTIMDLEDLIAAVDPGDKVAAYRYWLGLPCRGTLVDTFPERRQAAHLPAQRGSKLYRARRWFTDIARPQPDADPQRRSPDDGPRRVLDGDGEPAPEGVLDAVTSLIALHDLKGKSAVRNSRAGSIYIVKPKMHGRGSRVRQRSSRSRRGNRWRCRATPSRLV